MNEIEKLNHDLFLGESSEELEKKEFKINDVGSADWALSEVKKTEMNFNKRIEYLKSIIEKATVMKNELEEKINSENQFLISKLEEWAADSIKGQKSRSIKLLNGTLGFRKSPAKVEIEIENQAASFCEEKKLNINITLKANIPAHQKEPLFSLVRNYLSKDVVEKITVDKASIKDFFKSKNVDDAEFPGGKYSSGSDKFYIK